MKTKTEFYKNKKQLERYAKLCIAYVVMSILLIGFIC